MTIRKADSGQIDDIMTIFDHAKVFMASHGNPNQWVDGYPQRYVIEEDIREERGYVCEENGKVYAYFMLLAGEEPTYRVIQGAWLNQLPYQTLHRVASTGERRGMMDFIVRWALERCQNLRGDTYKDNLPMQLAFERNGFRPCGLIWIDPSKPRIAYHRPPMVHEEEKPCFPN